MEVVGLDRLELDIMSVGTFLRIILHRSVWKYITVVYDYLPNQLPRT